MGDPGDRGDPDDMGDRDDMGHLDDMGDMGDTVGDTVARSLKRGRDEPTEGLRRCRRASSGRFLPDPTACPPTAKGATAMGDWR